MGTIIACNHVGKIAYTIQDRSICCTIFEQCNILTAVSTGRDVWGERCSNSHSTSQLHLGAPSGSVISMDPARMICTGGSVGSVRAFCLSCRTPVLTKAQYCKLSVNQTVFVSATLFNGPLGRYFWVLTHPNINECWGPFGQPSISFSPNFYPTVVNYRCGTPAERTYA